MTVRVLNLLTRQEQVYTCTPRQAVMAPFAQSHRDFNTWDYETRYGELVLYGKKTVSCGDFCALWDDNVTAIGVDREEPKNAV